MRNFRSYLLGVAVTRDDTRIDALTETKQHPCRGRALGVTCEILLGNNRDCVAGCALDGSEDIIVDVRLVEILREH